jgi:hypothetical protein
MSQRAENRRLKRLMQQMARERGIGRCHGCGRRFDSPEVNHIGYAGDGQALTVGACCLPMLAVRLGFGIYADAKDAPPEWLGGVEPRGRA